MRVSRSTYDPIYNFVALKLDIFYIYNCKDDSLCTSTCCRIRDSDAHDGSPIVSRRRIARSLDQDPSPSVDFWTLPCCCWYDKAIIQRKTDQLCAGTLRGSETDCVAVHHVVFACYVGFTVGLWWKLGLELFLGDPVLECALQQQPGRPHLDCVMVVGEPQSSRSD